MFLQISLILLALWRLPQAKWLPGIQVILGSYIGLLMTHEGGSEGIIDIRKPRSTSKPWFSKAWKSPQVDHILICLDQLMDYSTNYHFQKGRQVKGSLRIMSNRKLESWIISFNFLGSWLFFKQMFNIDKRKYLLSQSLMAGRRQTWCWGKGRRGLIKTIDHL